MGVTELWVCVQAWTLLSNFKFVHYPNILHCLNDQWWTSCLILHPCLGQPDLGRPSEPILKVLWRSNVIWLIYKDFLKIKKSPFDTWSKYARYEKNANNKVLSHRSRRRRLSPFVPFQSGKASKWQKIIYPRLHACFHTLCLHAGICTGLDIFKLLGRPKLTNAWGFLKFCEESTETWVFEKCDKMWWTDGQSINQYTKHLLNFYEDEHMHASWPEKTEWPFGTLRNLSWKLASEYFFSRKFSLHGGLWGSWLVMTGDLNEPVDLFERLEGHWWFFTEYLEDGVAFYVTHNLDAI